MKWVLTTIGYDHNEDQGIVSHAVIEQEVEAARFEVHESWTLLFFKDLAGGIPAPNPFSAVPAGRWISVETVTAP